MKAVKDFDYYEMFDADTACLINCTLQLTQDHE